MLAGTFSDDEGDWGPGSYLLNPEAAGTRPRVAPVVSCSSSCSSTPARGGAGSSSTPRPWPWLPTVWAGIEEKVPYEDRGFPIGRASSAGRRGLLRARARGRTASSCSCSTASATSTSATSAAPGDAFLPVIRPPRAARQAARSDVKEGAVAWLRANRRIGHEDERERGGTATATRVGAITSSDCCRRLGADARRRRRRDALERNLWRMAAHAKAEESGSPPQTKTHKRPLLPKRQLELGAIGVRAVKVSEAEVTADAASRRCWSRPGGDPRQDRARRRPARRRPGFRSWWTTRRWCGPGEAARGGASPSAS